MKKGLKLLICALCAVSFIACNPSTNDKGGGNQEVTKTLQQQIDDGKSTGLVDFNNAKIEENASVDDKITIKNLDMGGKTLTITTSGVVLENVKNATVIVADGDVTLKNCTNINKLEVKKTSNTDSVVIDASKIDTIEINKEGLRIVLKDEKTEVKDVVVSAKNTTVEAEKKTTESDASKTPVIEKLTVKEDAGNVSVSGGKIENLKVETTDTTTSTTTKPTVTITGETEITAIEGTDTVSVAPEAKETVKVPETVTKTEIKVFGYAIYDAEALKTEYTIGDAFDYTNLAVKVTYTNGSTKVIPLTAENCEIKGFNSASAASLKIEVWYKTNFIGDFTVVIRKPVKTEGSAREYLDAAIEALVPVTQHQIPDVDLALSYFKKAYETEQTDETKLYYALAEVASLSTDENVAKLLKENFGIKNYPASMNALLSGSWMKEYLVTTPIECYFYEKNPNGNYIRGNRKTKTESKDSALSFSTKSTKYEEYWIYPFHSYSGLLEIEPSATGDTMFEISCYKNYFYAGTGSDTERAEKEYNDFKEANKDYIYSLKERKTVMLPASARSSNSSSDKAVIFDFQVIDSDDPAYQATLYNSMKTSETMSYLMLSNFFTCNANGFNRLIDDILNVFGTRYENAKALVKDFTQESVELQAEYIKALNLTDVLGENTIKIGKAEVDAFFAAMDVLKGLFQWFSSYDLSLDIESTIKEDMFQLYNPNYSYSSWSALPSQYLSSFNSENFISKLYALTNEKTFAVRSSDAMAASKATILNALKTALASYDYITGASKLYPDAVKTKMKELADPVYANVSKFAEALENNGIFQIQVSGSPVTYFKLDLGKLFTAGYFSDLLEKNSKGDIKFTAASWSGSVEGNDSQRENVFASEFLDKKMHEIDLSDTYVQLPVIMKPEAEALPWNKYIRVSRLNGYLSFKWSKIVDLMPEITDEFTAKMGDLYDKSTGILSIPVQASAYSLIYKPLEDMTGNWYTGGFGLETLNIFENYGAKDDDILYMNVLNTSNPNCSGSVFLGDIKTIKESGYVLYAAMNKDVPALVSYTSKDKIPEKLAFSADDTATPGKVKIFIYSNMSETNSELQFRVQAYEKPSTKNYSSGMTYISYTDPSTGEWDYGYSKRSSTYLFTPFINKVQ